MRQSTLFRSIRIGRSFARTAIVPALPLGLLFLAGLATPAAAVPAFVAQTGQPCQACHVGGLGPQLTPFGRTFKLGGYVMRTNPYNIPLSAMAVTSGVRTRKDQASPPASGFKRNDNVGLDQISLFFAGGMGTHVGGFVQTTYDGIGKAWSWDNVDLRLTTRTTIKGADVIIGASLNNSPGVQDPWNTLPAWGFPYTGSDLAPGPAAAPILSGALAQTSLGLTGYAWINSAIYLEAGGYGSPSRSTLGRLGANPYDPGDIKGTAPYVRVAYQTDLDGGTFEIGGFGLRANLYPARDRTTGMSDRYSDLGVDTSFIKTLESGDMLTLNGRYTHESRKLDASCSLAAGPAGCGDTRLSDLRADASYYWRNKVGFTASAFDTFGPANAISNPDSRTFKPDSSGLVFQIDGTPFGDGSSPLGKRFNLRVGVQYTIYNRFDGSRSDYDGLGHDASDNNTARVFAWFAY